jgi:EAL domain-containing protein (putative c-di-GMP-specific phosphodiesterase class I)
VLEVTEHVLVDESDRAWDFLADLRRDGIRVAIDDFGTGHASLSYLRRPDIDILKIDQSFLADISSPQGRILLRAVTYPGAALGLDQIAEGIEDVAARDAAVAAGCHYGQGFLYAPAMPLAEAAQWLQAVT